MQICALMSIAALFAIAKTGNKPNIYEQVNRFFKMVVYLYNGIQVNNTKGMNY